MDGLSSPRVHRGLALSDGEILVATDRALDRISNGEIVASYDHANPVPITAGHVVEIATDASGGTWLATADGLIRFEDDSFTRMHPGLPDSRVLCLLATDNAMLVGTWSGLARVTVDGTVTPSFGPSLPERPVTALFAGERLWAGFAGDGLWVSEGTGPFFPVVESWQGHALTITTLTEVVGGDMWIGTAASGLLRWRSSTKAVESMLCAQVVLCSTRDTAGNIWIGTNLGVYRWHESKLQQLSTPASETAITAFAAHGDDRMLVGTWGEGLWNCGGNGQCAAAGLDGQEIVDVAVIDGVVWVTTTDGLAVGITTQVQDYQLALTGTRLGLVHPGRGEDVLIGGEGGGLYQFNRQGEQIRYYHADHHLPKARVLSLAQDADQSLWIGTAHGLFRFDGTQFVPARVTPDDALKVFSLLADPNGDLWVGTGSGLYRRSGGQFRGVALGKIGATAVIRALLADGDHLWVGTDDGLFHRRASEPWQRLGVRDGLPSRRVRGLALNGDRQVWIATTGGMAMYHDGTLNRVGPAQSPSGPFTCLLVDSRDQIWMGSMADGAWHFDGAQYHHFSTRNGLASNAVWDLFEVEGSVWLATDLGLARIAEQQGDDR